MSWESYDFSGKMICPLITHGGGGFFISLKDIARLCPGAAIKEGLAIHGDDAGKSDKALDNGKRFYIATLEEQERNFSAWSPED